MNNQNYIREKAKLRNIPAMVVWVFYAIVCIFFSLNFLFFLEKVYPNFDNDVLFAFRWTFILSLTGIISLWSLRLGKLSKEERIFSTFRKSSGTKDSLRHQLTYVLFLLSLGFLFIFSILFQKGIILYWISISFPLYLGIIFMVAGFWNWGKYCKSINKNK